MNAQKIQQNQNFVNLKTLGKIFIQFISTKEVFILQNFKFLKDQISIEVSGYNARIGRVK